MVVHGGDSGRNSPVASSKCCLKMLHLTVIKAGGSHPDQSLPSCFVLS